MNDTTWPDIRQQSTSADVCEFCGRPWVGGGVFYWMGGARICDQCIGSVSPGLVHRPQYVLMNEGWQRITEVGE